MQRSEQPTVSFTITLPADYVRLLKHFAHAQGRHYLDLVRGAIYGQYPWENRIAECEQATEDMGELR